MALQEMKARTRTLRGKSAAFMELQERKSHELPVRGFYLRGNPVKRMLAV